MQHNVVALRGEEARKAYFDNKGLSFTEGYKMFMGGVRNWLRLLSKNFIHLNLSITRPLQLKISI